MTVYFQIHHRYNHPTGSTQQPSDDEALQRSTPAGQKLAYCLSAVLQDLHSACLCQFALNIYNSLGSLTSVKHFITQTISTQGVLLL